MDYQPIETTDIKWAYIKHISYSGGKGNMMYRDNLLGVQYERCNKDSYFFIDSDPREFRTEEELVQAYNETRRSHATYVRVEADEMAFVVKKSALEAAEERTGGPGPSITQPPKPAA